MTVSAHPASAPEEPQFKHYDRDLIREDLEQRVTFARDFLRFTEADGKTLNMVAPLISPLIKPTVDGVYSQLFRFDYTSIPFLKNNVGFEGTHAETLAQLNHDDPQITYRKKILSGYVGKMFTSDFEKFSTWAYFDKVAAMHTGLAAFKHRANKDPLVVDLQPMALLLGWIVDVVVKAVLELPEETADVATKTAVITAFNKLVWIQNDLFNKYYSKTDAELAAATATAKEADPSA
ncbi:hypothetical protein JCM8202_004547 [Rhodotorula sphaerocarpa]